MTSPRFSVVMPLFNKGPHVEAAIQSVLDQSFAPLELIVIDDSSTDGGRERVAAMARPEIRLLTRDTPGPGGYAARNLGIVEAAGDWVAFLDADDIWLPDHLAVLADLIGQMPTAGMAATRFDHVFDTHRQPQRVTARLAESGEADFGAFLAAWLDVRECPMWTGAIAIRRDLLMRVGLFPEGRALRGGDKDLWLRCARHMTLAYSPRVTAEFNRDSTNKVSKSTSTLAPPCLVRTAREMLADADAAERRLLRRLINQEIGYYLRYAMKSPGRVGIGIQDVALPEGVRTLALLVAVRWIPATVRQSAYRLFTRRRMERGGGLLAAR
ncbi:glycosyltransferase family 2 protein [Sphingobium sp. BYY-5]|uniref:glycosyltransferase family 2 protein n=1 Tax=Sphingobium sp. BYY-5 TaxID=2926400 RepID=UPI001FA7952C|nr:glycosyltransferase family A protein [Sphingobium sp. BYY-5]MCI4592665.1 glycosyltransferase family 2 protein [Sphingobium sp. BYY-5]